MSGSGIGSGADNADGSGAIEAGTIEAGTNPVSSPCRNCLRHV